MSNIWPDEYMDLAGACLYDNFDRVKDILDEFPKIDLNIGRNGTPLILTGSAEIGQLLLDRGAKVNQDFDHISAVITALDSAQKTLEGMKKSNHKNTDMLDKFVIFLKEKGAKTYEELEKEGK